MGLLDGLIDTLGSKTFYLEITSWRQFLQNATRTHSNDPMLKLQCRAQREGLLHDFTVGEEPEEDLYALGYSIDIRSGEKFFSDFDSNNPEKAGETLGYGIMTYHPPISSGDGVVDDKMGSVTGTAFFGNKTILEISRLLNYGSNVEISVWVSVKATSTASPNALIYQTRDHLPAKYHWSQKEVLVVTEAVFVATPSPEPDSNLQGAKTSKAAGPWRFLKPSQ